MTELRFTAWAKTPLGAAVDRDDTLADLGPATFHPGVTVRPPDGQDEQVLGPSFEVVGPGAVTGIDPGVVVRMDPVPGAVDVEPNYLAAIEFSLPELPWILTPARAAADRLRPWIVLVVVEATVAITGASPLRVLQAPVADLPDLSDSWGWAHVQTPESGAPGEVARLLCPRRLKPHTEYRACVVPGFTSGRRAGLGDPNALAAPNTPAWPTGQDPVPLPVYLEWTFTTGDEGNFEALVRRLRGAEEGTLTAAARIVDVGRPFRDDVPLLNIDEPQTMAMQGVLRPFGPEPEGISEPAFADWSGKMTNLLETPKRRLEQTAAQGDVTGAVAPPLYGGRHIQRDEVHAEDNAWIEELNLGPAHRVAAGLGAEYVRANQEDLMARAWEQVGAIRELNRRRALAELATNVAESIHEQHLTAMTPGELVAFAAPAQGRTRTAAGATLGMEIAFSPIVDSVASTAFARFMRPRGALARRLPTSIESLVTGGLSGAVTTREPPRPLRGLSADAPVMATDTDLGQASAELVDTAQAAAVADQLAVLGAFSAVASANQLGDAATQLDQGIATLGLTPAATDAMAAGDVATLQTEVAAMPRADLTQSLTSFVATLQPVDGQEQGPITDRGVPVDAGALRDRMVDSLQPGDRLERRLGDVVAAPERLNPSGLGPVMAYPSFPVPTAMALLDTDPEWFLPGLGAFPTNRVVLLTVNAQFVESYLVGINHEMMRELLWREYPTDQRGTAFAVFWPRPDGQPDIGPIDGWGNEEFSGAIPLGSHLTLGAGELAVLLVRGDVLRRFPDVVVTAAQATVVDDHVVPAAGAAAREPLFTIRIDESTNAYAFELPKDQLGPAPTREAPGWFFVFQEHSYRMRFGFDVLPDPPTPQPEFSSWDGLAWPNQRGSGEVPMDRDFARAGAGLAPPAGVTDPTWNRDATDVARIALRRPFKLAYHAHKLLGVA